MSIYFPLLLLVLGVTSLLLLIGLDEMLWYRNWSRKRQWKRMRKHYDKTV
jgi:hypothetical protein